jgi:predicted ATPase
MRTLAAIREAGVKTQEIVLEHLGLDDVDQLVAAALHCDRNTSGPLALLYHEKTGDNPFFVILFLTWLADEGLLRFDRDSAAWVWPLDRIFANGYSGDVAELVVAKLRRLSDMTQSLSSNSPVSATWPRPDH